jgi:hypothetical protein
MRHVFLSANLDEAFAARDPLADQVREVVRIKLQWHLSPCGRTAMDPQIVPSAVFPVFLTESGQISRPLPLSCQQVAPAQL